MPGSVPKSAPGRSPARRGDHLGGSGGAGPRAEGGRGAAGIHLCGGSKLAGELVDEIDELVLKTYPLVLGSGMPMFASEFAFTRFALESVRTFGNGVLVSRHSRTR